MTKSAPPPTPAPIVIFVAVDNPEPLSWLDSSVFAVSGLAAPVFAAPVPLADVSAVGLEFAELGDVAVGSAWRVVCPDSTGLAGEGEGEASWVLGELSVSSVVADSTGTEGGTSVPAGGEGDGEGASGDGTGVGIGDGSAGGDWPTSEPQ
jgi:hypothetical protein